MNEFLKNTDRIEFTVTLACTGRCRHCSEGDHIGCREHIDADVATASIRKICECYKIKSLMTFGGEPLLYPDVVCAIHSTARDLGIAKRQLITNGFFSKDLEMIQKVAKDIALSGVNDLLLSVDAFHQETIPMEPVKIFAESLVAQEVPVRISPAWLVSTDDDNPYNNRTRELIDELSYLGIPTGEGNVIFPRGNALKYLKEYFPEGVSESSPYDEDPRDIRAISFDPNGDVLGGNIYKTDILDIMRDYRP